MTLYNRYAAPLIRLKSLAAAFILLFGSTLGAGGEPDLTLDQVLERIDRRSQDLSSLQAVIEIKLWIDILDEFDAPENGHIYLLRGKEQTFLRRQIDLPRPKILTVKNGRAIYYEPRLKEAAEYDVGRKKDGSQNFLVGFGADRQALERDFDVNLPGRESVSETDAYILELTPKSERVKAEYQQFVLWLDPQLWVPVRYRIVLPNRDYQQWDFSEVRVNEEIEKSLFDQKLPKDVIVKKL